MKKKQNYEGDHANISEGWFGAMEATRGGGMGTVCN